MRILKGIPASSGIATGKVFLYEHETLEVPHEQYTDDGRAAKEVVRFSEAMAMVRGDLKRLGQTSLDGEQKDILQTHLMMLEDPEFDSGVRSYITTNKVNAEWAVEVVATQFVKTLEAAGDPALRERSVDLKDVSLRIMSMLMGVKRVSLATLSEDVVLVSDSLLPTEVLSMDRMHILGIALNGSGRTSHVAILARSFNIPTVVGLGAITKKVKAGDEIIVDGNHGEVVVRPEWSTAQNLRDRYDRWIAHEEALWEVATLPSETTDGHRVVLKANVEMVDELDAVLRSGGEGIGLYRSEFLFMRPGGLASEEEQFAAYRKVVERMQGKGPVTIRTIDVGGDKVVPGLGIDEENPILGWRAVRFCLSRKDIFRVQLRALLRASAYGELRIMFPMISGIEELEGVLLILEQVKDECRKAHVPFDENVQVGTMIEVPSAALCADILAKRVDFFSIGTNDLIQYTIAVDRGNEKIAYLYQPYHPGVLRFIRMIIEKGHAAGIPVGMCGEMAGDAMSAVLLTGLGLDEFSMSPQSLLEVRKIIRGVSFSEAQALAEHVMKMDSYLKINTYVREWMHERFDYFTSV
ncbi:MAG: phosphoenolpyruvate--protein phosphotransferase [Sphaerochaetaceae bacterium]|jgi:phosphotransferase system enzyme I (PtsI)